MLDMWIGLAMVEDMFELMFEWAVWMVHVVNILLCVVLEDIIIEYESIIDYQVYLWIERNKH